MTDNAQDPGFDITFRDYLAAKSMQSILTNDSLLYKVAADESLGKNPKDRVAKAAYAYADAMMKARAK